MHNWLLPEYIEDILPPQALQIEAVRRRLLDMFHVRGYQLVIPPLLEYVESLLTGTGHDMDLRTFKVVDQLSGRLLGLRADITPQVARIDAHLLNRSGVTRLCYAGSVLHTLPGGLTGTREPMQIGAEIYGHAGIESDIEIQELLLQSLAECGVKEIQFDIGHVGIFRALVRHAEIGEGLERQLFRALQAKDIPTVGELVGNLPAPLREGFLALPSLYGGADVLKQARSILPALPDVEDALRDLEILRDRLSGSQTEICFDLAELRGYHYHSGVVFAAYAPGIPNALAKGGRYDEVGEAFGRARPATGFSLDLREIARTLTDAKLPRGILAPWSADRALLDMIAQLRAAGEVVVVALPGHGSEAYDDQCDRVLERVDQNWVVKPLKNVD